jgi:acyl-CoA dehydrogenase
MAITEPEAGSDSGAIRTTAVKDGQDYVLNGEKIFVTGGERAELVVVWATLDRSLGKAAIKSFVVERDQPGPQARPARAQARHPGVRHRRVPPRQLPGALE